MILCGISFLILFLVGWTIWDLWLRSSIRDHEVVFFAPALGVGLCGLVTFLASLFNKFEFISIFAVLVLVWTLGFRRGPFINYLKKVKIEFFPLLALLSVIAIQTLLFNLCERTRGTSNNISTVEIVSGVCAADQLTSWHQAEHILHNKVYSPSSFYGDIDYYDRPHLGGYLTAFFFKLFRLDVSITEVKPWEYVYPTKSVKFFQTFWWLQNDLYLLGLWILIRRLFGKRSAIMAVGCTLASSSFVLSSMGEWAKFACTYPLTLALVLMLGGGSIFGQIALCVAAFHLHGSSLPFVVGLGAMHIYRFLRTTKNRGQEFRRMAAFGCGVLVGIVPYFLIAKWSGSKQALQASYLYHAGWTEAQTVPLSTIIKNFYASTTLGSLAFLPSFNLLKFFLPTLVVDYVNSFKFGVANFFGTHSLSVLSFQTQVTNFFGIFGLSTLLVVFSGFRSFLGKTKAGPFFFCIGMLPLVFVSFMYRGDGVFLTQICPFSYIFASCCLVLALRSESAQILKVILFCLSFEGVWTMLNAKDRYTFWRGGLLEGHLGPSEIGVTLLYICFMFSILGLTFKLIGKTPIDTDGPIFVEEIGSSAVFPLHAVFARAGIGLFIFAMVTVFYSLYNLRFFYH